MGKRLGKQTVALADPPVLRGWAAVGGKKEGEGPLKNCFDQVAEDPYFGEMSWEKAESRMLRICFSLACDKAGLPPSKLDYIISGDLLNQCISSAFAMRDTAVPFARRGWPSARTAPPAASAEASKLHTLPLPFVPATCTHG